MGIFVLYIRYVVNKYLRSVVEKFGMGKGTCPDRGSAMASRQPECADILGVAQAASAIAPETEFPSQPNIQLPLEQDERVDQVGALHLDAIRLLCRHAKAMRELHRQQQRGRSGAACRHMHGPTLEHHL